MTARKITDLNSFIFMEKKSKTLDCNTKIMRETQAATALSEHTI